MDSVITAVLTNTYDPVGSATHTGSASLQSSHCTLSITDRLWERSTFAGMRSCVQCSVCEDCRDDRVDGVPARCTVGRRSSRPPQSQTFSLAMVHQWAATQSPLKMKNSESASLSKNQSPILMDVCCRPDPSVEIRRLCINGMFDAT